MYDLLFNLGTQFGARFIDQLSFARLFESFILLGLIWKKIEPKFDGFEKRLAGIEVAVKDGFHSGEERFSKIETRLTEVENAIERES